MNKMIKSYAFFISLVLVLIFIGCEDSHKEGYGILNIEISAKTPMSVEVFYLKSNNLTFNEQYKIVKRVLGESKIENLKFKLPKEALNQSFRIDFDSYIDNLSKPKIESITLKNEGKQIVISKKEINYFFEFNKYLELSTNSGELTFKTISGRSDPFMVSKPIFVKRIKIEL